MTDLPLISVFTIRHRKALVAVLASLTHHQLDELLREHPVSGDPGNGAAKTARVELIVRTMLEVEGQHGLHEGLALIDVATLTDEQAKALEMLNRRVKKVGYVPPARESEAQTDLPAETQTPQEKHAEDGGESKQRRSFQTVPAQQLVAIGGTQAMREQLESLEGLEVVLVEDQGTRAQAMAVLAAVATALQTPGAVVAVGGPTEMLTRLSMRG